jgi:glycosyltransferase involved in cell wall biosynthesis
MKMICLIDSLGSGGAQRQLCLLAVGLKKRGHEVRLIVYHQEDHFLPLLQEAGIACEVVPQYSYVQRAWAIRRILQQGWQDVVLAFVEAPSFYAELASIPKRSWGLVVGERLADPGMRKGAGPWLRQFHRLADAVVCNSHTNQLMLEEVLSFLKPKLATVYNTVDLNLFRPLVDGSITDCAAHTRQFRIVVAASYQAKKNMMHVAKALLILKEMRSPPSVVVDWFGAVPRDSTAFNCAERFVAENGLAEMLKLNPATRDIAGEYARADAVGLFSFFEGLPNVVCEGMACGKPILLSHVCDAGNLVQDGVNGFLCDPASPEDIADKIQRMVTLSESERQRMGLASRRMAEHLFAAAVVLEHYERILTCAARRESMPTDCSWPPHAPESAIRTMERWRKGC